MFGRRILGKISRANIPVTEKKSERHAIFLWISLWIDHAMKYTYIRSNQPKGVNETTNYAIELLSNWLHITELHNTWFFEHFDQNCF